MRPAVFVSGFVLADATWGVAQFLDVRPHCMRTGDFKLWRSQIVCWGLFILFSVVATVLVIVGSREPNKSYSESELRTRLVAGIVFGVISVACLILAIRAKIRKGHDAVA